VLGVTVAGSCCRGAALVPRAAAGAACVVASGADAVDVGVASRGVETPAAARVPRDGVGHVLPQFVMVGQHEPPLDDRAVQPLAGRQHPTVALRKRDDVDAALLELLDT
jgi:hypothetical protein